MMFIGAKFCSHCGAKAERAEVLSQQIRLCPRCRVNTNALVLGKTNLRECPRCEGIWADAEALQTICADREQQAAVLGVAMTLHTPNGAGMENVRYVPCPVCKKLMNRVNFAHCSSVVVDVCQTHGTWFDKDELRRIVEFIRGGGLEKARAKELEELERQRRELKAAKIAATQSGGSGFQPGLGDGPGSVLSSAAAAIARSFFD
jgi:Zn-finger nucleic acid-binding protein